MHFMMVEPINTKLSAYHFDGTRESALEAIDKWDGITSNIDGGVNYKIIFNDGSVLMPGDYILMIGGNPVVCSQKEFVTKYRIVYDMRDRIGSFYSID
jgi:hypothetical protein